MQIPGPGQFFYPGQTSLPPDPNSIAQAIQAISAATATATRLQAEADNQAMLSRIRARVQAHKILQEHWKSAQKRSQTNKDEQPTALVAEAAVKQQHKAPVITPVKVSSGLPPADSVTWDLQTRSRSKHLREIVADRAPSPAEGARLWGKMMETPSGTDKVPLHIRLMIRYKGWAHYTEAGFLFHPCCFPHINAELDKHNLRGHLDWVLAN